MANANMTVTVDVQVEKNARGRITGYTATFFGILGQGPTKQLAIAACHAQLIASVRDLGHLAVVSDPLADFHVVVCPTYGGDWCYRHMRVTDGQVTLSGSSSGGNGRIFDGALRAATEHLHQLLHGTCRLCHVVKPWVDLVYYASPHGDCPMHVCHVCESASDRASILKRVTEHVPHRPTMRRIGDIAPNGTHPKLG
jgi:hypothetical protein